MLALCLTLQRTDIPAATAADTAVMAAEATAVDTVAVMVAMAGEARIQMIPQLSIALAWRKQPQQSGLIRNT